MDKNYISILYDMIFWNSINNNLRNIHLLTITICCTSKAMALSTWTVVWAFECWRRCIQRHIVHCYLSFKKSMYGHLLLMPIVSFSNIFLLFRWLSFWGLIVTGATPLDTEQHGSEIWFLSKERLLRIWCWN